MLRRRAAPTLRYGMQQIEGCRNPENELNQQIDATGLISESSRYGGTRSGWLKHNKEILMRPVTGILANHQSMQIFAGITGVFLSAGGPDLASGGG